MERAFQKGTGNSLFAGIFQQHRQRHHCRAFLPVVAAILFDIFLRPLSRHFCKLLERFLFVLLSDHFSDALFPQRYFREFQRDRRRSILVLFFRDNVPRSVRPALLRVRNLLRSLLRRLFHHLLVLFFSLLFLPLLLFGEPLAPHLGHTKVLLVVGGRLLRRGGHRLLLRA